MKSLSVTIQMKATEIYYSVNCDLNFCFRGYDMTSIAVLSQCAICFSR